MCQESPHLQVGEYVNNLTSLDVDYSSFTMDLEQDLEDYFLRNAIRVNYLSPDNLASDSQQVLEFDCATVDRTKLVEFSKDFQFSVSKHAKITGFLGWFTTDFPNGVVLNTEPGKTYKHWGMSMGIYSPSCQKKKIQLPGMI